MKKTIKIILIIFMAICITLIALYGLAHTPIFSYLGMEHLCLINRELPLEYYSSESADIVNNLSQNQIISIVEYIRDSVITGDSFVKENKSNDPNKNGYYYFGYQSTLPGVDYQKAWKLSPGLTTEISFDRYLKAWDSSPSPNLPDAIYSIHFFEINYGSSLCVTVQIKYNYKTFNNKQPWYVDTWSFGQVFPGKWEFKRILTGTSSYDPR